MMPRIPSARSLILLQIASSSKIIAQEAFAFKALCMSDRWASSILISLNVADWPFLLKKYLAASVRLLIKTATTLYMGGNRFCKK